MGARPYIQSLIEAKGNDLSDTTYSKRERLNRLINGEKIDRPLVTVWRHFYHRETTAHGLADAMCEFQERFDWDFMKINPRASYHLEDWGNELIWSTDEFTKHVKSKFAVTELSDWDRIGALRPDAPVLAEILNAIQLIRTRVGPDLPLLMTVFTPLSIAGDLVKDDQTLLEHIKQDGARVEAALNRITETFSMYVKEIFKAGADGLFYATTQWASRTLLTYEEYTRFGRRYDLPVLKSTGEKALNLLHVCASENYLKELSDYPVQLINWDESDPTNASLRDGIDMVAPKIAVGGLDHEGWLRQSNPGEVEFKVREIFHNMRGKRFIFGPGCSIPPETPMENLAALSSTIKTLKY